MRRSYKLYLEEILSSTNKIQKHKYLWGLPLNRDEIMLENLGDILYSPVKEKNSVKKIFFKIAQSLRATQ